MDAQHYLINGREFLADDPALQEALARVYGTPVRPRCLCVRGGVEMYVSKFDEYVIKRMPDTGGLHRPICPSYEPPAGDSGLGQVLGEAIIERRPDLIELRLDFPLTRRIGHSHAVRATQSATEVNVARKQLSLRGLLHYLWERAGFNRWYPRMQGKRSYAVLHKFLLQACEDIETKGLRLCERVFMPEPFVLDRATEITIRHRKALALLLSPEAPAHFKVMIATGELKELKATTVGHQLIFKHLSDCALFLERRAGERAKRVFERELLAWSNGQVKLIAACLIHAKQDHCYGVDSLTLMMVSPQWIPLDHACEKDVVEKLVAEERAFIKPLRYDAPDNAEFPNFQLLDTGARPVGLDILNPFVSEGEHETKVNAIRTRDPKGWAWDTALGPIIPDLPPRAAGRGDRRLMAASAGGNVSTLI